MKYREDGHVSHIAFSVRYGNRTLTDHLDLTGCDLGLFPGLACHMGRTQDMLRLRSLAGISGTQSHWAASGGWGRAKASAFLRGVRAWST